MAFNFSIPCPGCQAVASVFKEGDVTRVSKVDVYPPKRSNPITMPGEYWDDVFGSEADVKRIISKDLNAVEVEIVVVSI